jgi:hypothetical protein
MKVTLGYQDYIFGAITFAIGIVVAHWYFAKAPETKAYMVNEVNLTTKINAILDELELPAE